MSSNILTKNIHSRCFPQSIFYKQISNKRLLICMDVKETKVKTEFDLQEYYVFKDFYQENFLTCPVLWAYIIPFNVKIIKTPQISKV